MNVLFLTLCDIRDITEHGIYEDLIREFSNNDHNIFVVSPIERRYKTGTQIIESNNCHILKVKCGNIQKTNIFEKGIATIRLESILVKAIKKYLCNIKFDLVIYSTPPITIAKTVELIKKRDNAKTYLLLKDIFPQNAVDLGMMKKHGFLSLFYHYFRRKEKNLYALSDDIGCMSQANVDYVLRHNPEITRDCVEICPNSIEPRDMSVSSSIRAAMRKRYGIPQDKIVFVYGGNLGKPQGISFLIECLKSQINNSKVFFLIIGAGTEFNKIEAFVNDNAPANVKLMCRLPKEDYDQMVGSCDVGMIFLDYRFTIPNFPSRILSYMQAKLPVFAVTDKNSDIGNVVSVGGFGWWCESRNVKNFVAMIDNICRTSNFITMRTAAWEYLQQHYTVNQAYQKIINKCRKR